MLFRGRKGLFREVERISLYPQSLSVVVKMWLATVLRLVVLSNAAPSLTTIQVESVRNIHKLVSWEKDQSATSSQFILGVSIGLQFLMKSALNESESELKGVIDELNTSLRHYLEFGDERESELK